MTVNNRIDIREELNTIINEAYEASNDLGTEIAAVLKLGRERPLSHEEALGLLTQLLAVLKDNAQRSGDEITLRALSGDLDGIIERVMRVRDRIDNGMSPVEVGQRRVDLSEMGGIKTGPVLPTPVFHGRRVPVMSGFVKTTDISLWPDNERLDIHLAQFERQYGKKPSPPELIDIMLSRTSLPGTTGKDEFEITDLARSIAANGVRVPPIIDLDGTLLDGNRRVTACYYILNSDEFSVEQKRRAEHLFVWQLTEHATDDDRIAVVVSLNFEPSYKKDWPEYVKARKIYDDWQAILDITPPSVTSQQLSELKKQLSMKYALGPDTRWVNRYIKMVEMAIQFEEYHIANGKDEFAVKHRANVEFQYFDELGKGTNPGGVQYALNQDDSFKGLVFDLLLQDKFRNWTLIRNLRHYNQEVRDTLARARDETDIDEAKDLVEQTLTDASNQQREARVTAAPNARIKSFVDWLENLPLGAVRDKITPESRQRLHDALRLVDGWNQTLESKVEK